MAEPIVSYSKPGYNAEHEKEPVFIIYDDGSVFTDLPASDPGVAGQLYVAAGAVMVSTGA